jgi:DNA-binding response OmpR family regulator
MSRIPILIIDDDKSLCALLTDRLEAEGFHLSAAHDGRRGLESAATGAHALVILDVMLPGLGGLEVLKALRSTSTVPVLMLTARGDDVDRIIGLEYGADDYLAKPFNTRELVARIRAVLRRLDERRAGPKRLSAGDITVDVEMREAWVGKELIQVTTIEFAILEALVRNAGRILTRDFLTNVAMGRGLGAFDRSVDVHISNLRRKLDRDSGRERIKTVRGNGYMLAPHRMLERAEA